MKQTPIFLIFFSLFTGSIYGQITGKIIDSDNKSPLEYATAALYSISDQSLIAGVITLEDGSFSIDNIGKGSYYLEASFMGYEAKTIQSIIVNKRNSPVSVGTILLSINNDECIYLCVCIGELRLIIWLLQPAFWHFVLADSFRPQYHLVL